MKTKRAVAALVGSGALMVALLGGASTVLATDNAPHKVTLCHATSSETHPYVQITVDIAAGGIKGGHAGHGRDGVWYPGAKAAGFDWGDIIPAYDYGAGYVYAGLNLTAEGVAILGNGCKAPEEPSEPFITTDVHLGDGVDESNPVVVNNANPATDQDKVHDSALLEFPGDLPNGSSVTFQFFHNGTCSGEVADDQSDAIPVSGTSPIEIDPGLVEGPLAAGDYSFRAVFISGDTEAMTNATGDCEPFKVIPFVATDLPATDVPTEPNTATVGAGTSRPSDGSWLFVAALGVILASVVVMTPARAKNRR
jgi:hypothetical protein